MGEDESVSDGILAVWKELDAASSRLSKNLPTIIVLRVFCFDEVNEVFASNCRAGVYPRPEFTVAVAKDLGRG